MIKKRTKPKRGRRESRLLDFLPLWLFASLSVLTFGIYPYVWFASNLRAFNELSADEKLMHFNVKYFAAAGAAAQLVLAFSAVSFLVSNFAAGVYIPSMLRPGRLFEIYFYGYIFFVLPFRFSAHLWLSWNIREATRSWNEGAISSITLDSWVKLLLFGSFYIQYHVNRLIGMGMDKLASRMDLRESKSVSDIIIDLVKYSDSEDLGDKGRR